MSDDWSHLMRAALDGDAAAYRRLLHTLTPVLRSFARRFLTRAGRDGAEAEDVVQETLLALHLKRQTWDPQTPLAPWVWAIARHKALDVLRRSGRRHEIPMEDLEALAAPDPGDDGLDAPLVERDARRIAATLSGRERDVVEAVCLSGASVKEAGARLAISEGAVRVALHRALRRLAAVHGGEEG